MSYPSVSHNVSVSSRSNLLNWTAPLSQGRSQAGVYSSPPVVSAVPDWPFNNATDPYFLRRNVPVFTRPMIKPTRRINIWTDTPLRFVAYANEVGQAWKEPIRDFMGQKVSSSIYWLSQIIGVAYAVADISDKTREVYRNPNPKSDKSPAQQALKEAGITGLFHLFATVIVPPAIVFGIDKAFEYLVQQSTFLTKVFPKKSHRYNLFPAILITACLPLISKPVDKLTLALMKKVGLHPRITWYSRLKIHTDAYHQDENTSRVKGGV